MRLRHLLAIVITCGALLSSSIARADVWELLNPSLAELREREFAALKELESLGDLKIGNSCDSIGSQFHMSETRPATPPFVQIDLGYPQKLDTVVVVPAVTGISNEGQRSYAFPTAFRLDVSDDQEFADYQSLDQYDDTNLESKHGLPIVCRCEPIRARYVRLTVTELAKVANRWTYALGEVMVLDGNRNVAIGSQARMRFSPKIPPRWHFDYLVDGRTPLGSPIENDLPALDGAYSVPKLPDDEKWMMVDVGKVMSLQEVRLHPIHARQGNSLPGYSFPRRFRVELFRDAELQNGSVVFDSRDETFNNPGNNPVTIAFPELEAQFVRVTCIEPSSIDPNRMGLSEMMVFSDGCNVAREGTATMNGQSDTRGPELLNDGYASYGRILDLSKWVGRWDRLRTARRELANSEHDIAVAEQVAYRRGRWLGGLSLASLLGVVAIVGVVRRHKSINERKRFRQRLAQDLHDEVGSNLAAIARLGEVAELESSEPQSQRDWQSVRQLALECTDSMRETLWLLGGPRHEGGESFERLRNTSQRMLPHATIDWNLPDALPQFDEQSQTPRELLLMFKEIMANIAKHAEADQVNVRVEYTEALKITVVDNGLGTISESETGMGLSNIRQRTAKLGGRFEFESTPGQGSTVVLEIPM